MAAHGVDAAVEISRFEIAHIHALKELIEKENIDCDFTLTRTFDVFLDEEQARSSKAAYDRLVTVGLEGMSDVHHTGPQNAEAVCGVKGAKACFSFTAAHLWPYKFIMWLLSRVVIAGMDLQTHTPVTHVETEADADGYYVVNTPRGLMKARKIVYACNGYTAGTLPQYGKDIVRCRSVCSGVKPSGKGRSLPYLSDTYSIRQGPRMFD